MRNKGFTLVELLAVIIIMGIIFMVVTANISGIISRSGEKQYGVLGDIMEKAAKIYIADTTPAELDDEGGEYCVTLQMLIDKGLIDTPVIDPRDDSEFLATTCIYVKNQGDNQITYTFNESPQNPVLTFNGSDPDTIACAATGNYTDPGADVTDPLDLAAPDVYSPTTLAKKTAGSYPLTYSYTSSLPMTITKTRTVNITNANLPTITVTGNPVTITIEQWTSFNAPTATATDICDGDITVGIASTVTPTIAGSYTVTYTATNAGGTTATKVVTVNVTPYQDSMRVNMPTLTTGLIPVYWDGTNWRKADSTNVSGPYNWFDYGSSSKMWANAVTTTATNRATYIAAAAGYLIPTAEINTQWVWIPRYIYKISSGWHTSSVETIDIKFSIGTDDTIGGTTTIVNTGVASDSNNTWTNHTGFNFGGTQLTGIWIAKFEGSGTTATATVKQGVAGLMGTTSELFTASRTMETNSAYGWPTTGTNMDVHMTKNVEWGAIAYLTQSQYGKNAKVWINNSNTHITGCAGVSANATEVAGCAYDYKTSNGIKASTTGNIYGIYDMAGGSYEHVAAYMNNATAIASPYATNLVSAAAKYKDVYTVTTDSQAQNYANIATSKKGEATYETSSAATGTAGWNSSYTSTPYTTIPFFTRGGFYLQPAGADLFNFYNLDGDYYINSGFRPVLLLATGL